MATYLYNPTMDPTMDPTLNQSVNTYNPSTYGTSSISFNNPFGYSTSSNLSGIYMPSSGVDTQTFYNYASKIAHNKSLFIIILYLLLLVFMFILVGMTLGTGTEQKQLTWAFYGFSIVTSIVSVFAIMKSYKSKTLGTWGMGLSSVIMFGLLLTSLIISKPSQSKDYLILSFITVSLVFLANLSAISLLKKQVFANSSKRGIA
jgi:hypothetical protein